MGVKRERKGGGRGLGVGVTYSEIRRSVVIIKLASGKECIAASSSSDDRHDVSIA